MQQPIFPFGQPSSPSEYFLSQKEDKNSNPLSDAFGQETNNESLGKRFKECLALSQAKRVNTENPINQKAQNKSILQKKLSELPVDLTPEEHLNDCEQLFDESAWGCM
jgi:hypothetical protein